MGSLPVVNYFRLTTLDMSIGLMLHVNSRCLFRTVMMHSILVPIEVILSQ